PSCPVRREAARNRTRPQRAPRRAADPTSWMNNFGKLRRNTERRRVCTELYLALAMAIITVRSLIRRAWYTHRWDTRPRSPRIR
ncbi:IS5/IS1182 family transposase, partial [Streptomyces sp. NPDC001817]